MDNDNRNRLANPHFLQSISSLHHEIDTTEAINVLRENNDIPDENNLGTSQISSTNVPTESVATAADPQEPGFGGNGFYFVQTGSLPIPDGTLPALGTGVRVQSSVVAPQSNTSHGQHISTNPLISNTHGCSGFLGFHNMTDGFSTLVRDGATEVNGVPPLTQHAAIPTWPGSIAGQFPRSSPLRPHINMPHISVGVSSGTLLGPGLTRAGTYAGREPNINVPSNPTNSRFPVANNVMGQVFRFPSRPHTSMVSPQDLSNMSEVRRFLRNPLVHGSSMVSPHTGFVQAATSGRFQASDPFEGTRHLPRPRAALGPGMLLTSRILSSQNRNQSRTSEHAVNMQHPVTLLHAATSGQFQVSDPFRGTRHLPRPRTALGPGMPLASRILSSQNRNPTRPPEHTVNLQHPVTLQVEQGESLGQTSYHAPIAHIRMIGVVNRSEPVKTTCYLCKRNLSYNPSGPISMPPIPPVAAVLPCGHAFHAECLDRITPAGHLGNPPCIPCALKRGNLHCGSE